MHTTTTIGTTPLDAASYAGNVDIVEYLSNNALCDVDVMAKTRME